MTALMVVAGLGAYATTAFATPAKTTSCIGCHNTGPGLVVTASELTTGNTDTTTAYGVRAPGAAYIAVFDGSTKIDQIQLDELQGWNGLLRVDNGKTYALQAVAGPGVDSGWGTTNVSPASTDDTSETLIPTSTPDVTDPETTCGATRSFRGDAAIRLTGTDVAGGWGIAYIYYSIDGDRTHLYRAPANRMSADTTVTIPAPPTGSASHTLTFWSQDNYGNVEAATTETFTVGSASKPATTLTLKCSDATITHGSYVTLTAQLKGGSGYANEYVRFEVIGSGLLHYKVYKVVKVSSTGYATYRYRISTRGTRYHRVTFAGSRSYLPAPLMHGIKLISR